MKDGHKKAFSSLENTPKNAIWFHIASAGEFEQASELIQLLHTNGEKIIVSFFSPSGYTAQKNNPLLSKVFYLPIDSIHNARKLLDTLEPKLCVLVKYDFWLNYMKELNRRNIPIVLVSGVFYNDQFLFKWYGKEHLKQIKKFKFISVQDEQSKKILELQNIQSTVTGDTRIDRSLKLPKEDFFNSHIEDFINNKDLVIVLGSVWQQDLQIWQERADILTKKNIGLIIAPHELDTGFLQKIQKDFKANLLSSYSLTKQTNALLIDQIGILKYIYRYADIAYIGGGFSKGIHNILEPASYGIPVIYGPKYKAFMEANILVETGGAFSVNSTSELFKTIAYLMIEKNRIKAGNAAYNYLDKYKGGSRKIFQQIEAIIS